MTLMEQMIERFRAMSPEDQEQMAGFVLHELDEDERWTATTARYPDAVKQLTERILADDAAGLCEPLDPDTL